MSKIWGAYDLTGGSTGDLDNINGDVLTAGDLAVVITTDYFYPYQLENDGAAQNPPDVIAPDVSPGNLRWKLRGYAGITNKKGFPYQAHWLNALTGGADDALDGIDGADININDDTSMTLDYTNKKAYWHAYLSGYTGDTEDSPTFIKPDVNPNADYGWELITLISGNNFEIHNEYESTTQGGKLTLIGAGTNSDITIDSVSGVLTIATDENLLKLEDDAGVTIYHNNIDVIATRDDGFILSDGTNDAQLFIEDDDMYIDVVDDWILQSTTTAQDTTIAWDTSGDNYARNTADDGDVRAGVFSSANNSCRIDSGGESFWRFDGIKIAPGAVITSFKVNIRANNTNNQTVTNNWHCNAADDAVAPTSTGEFNGLALTASSISWEMSTGWIDNTEWTSANMASVLQEVISRPGWEYNNAIMVVTDYDVGAGTKTVDSWNQGGNLTTIDIEFTQGIIPDLLELDRSRTYQNWSTLTLSNGNKTVTNNSTSNVASAGLAYQSTGKVYFEVKVENLVDSVAVGIGTIDAPLNVYLGKTNQSWSYNSAARKQHNDVWTGVSGGTWSTNDIIMVAFDADASKIWFGINGTWVDSGDPGAGTNEAFSSLAASTAFYPMIGTDGVGCAATLRIDTSDWTYSAPTGFARYASLSSGGTEKMIHAKSQAEVETYYNGTVAFQSAVTGIQAGSTIDPFNVIDAGGTTGVRLNDGDSVELWFNGNDVLETTATGFIVDAFQSVATGIQAVVSPFSITSSTTETFLTGTNDGAVELYYDDTAIFKTAATGLQFSIDPSYILTSGGNNAISITNGNSVDLYYNNTIVFETDSAGVSIGDGSNTFDAYVDATDTYLAPYGDFYIVNAGAAGPAVAWNPADKSANITLSGSNLIATATNTAWKQVRADASKAAGKWYWEYNIGVTGSNQIVGISESGDSVNTYPGGTAVSYGYRTTGQKYNNAAASAYGNSYTNGDVIGVALDLDAGKIWFSKANVWQAGGDPVAGTGEAFSGVSGTKFAAVAPYDNNNVITGVFAAGSLTYSPPSGYLGLEAGATETMFIAKGDDAIELYYDNTKEAETISGGLKATNSFTIAATTNVTGILDEDDLVSDSAVSLATQQSIKAYVDTRTAVMNLNGWEDRTDSTLSWVNGTRTLTLTPTSTSYYWIAGVRYSITSGSPPSLAISDVSGSHLIYIDSAGALQELVNPTHTQTDDAILNKCLVAWVYWNTTVGTDDTMVLGDERHGVDMDAESHHYLHDTHGAQYKEGATLSGYVLNSSADADVAFDLTDTFIYDEDIEHEISDGIAANQYEQVLTGDAEVPVLYKDTNGDWAQQAAATLPYILQGGDTYISYNDDLGGGSWGLVELGNQKFMLQFLIATNDWEYPIKMICGSEEYNTAALARVGIQTEIINWGDMPAAEFVLLYVFVLKASAGGTKAVQITEIQDFRFSEVSGAAYSPTDHGVLTGLGDDDHTQYLLRTDYYGRNMLINGAMQVLQRDVASELTGLGNGEDDTYLLDRWSYKEVGAPSSEITVTRDTDVPAGEKFGFSMKIDCTTAETLADNGTAVRINQSIEAKNLQHLVYGHANAVTTTLSFWLKSDTKTGTMCIFLNQDDGDRSYVSEISVSDNAWNEYEIEISGDTGGTIDNNNGVGLSIQFVLAAGTDRDGKTADTWAANPATDLFSTDNQDNFLDNVANNIWITGVQFEVGTTKTEYEYQPYHRVKLECMRYFERISYDQVGSAYSLGFGFVHGNSNAYCEVKYEHKRTLPSLSDDGTLANWVCTTASTALTPTGLVWAQIHFDRAYCNVQDTGATLTQDEGARLRFNASGGYIDIDAEL
jgi:hypothetical protein